jgi:hypothetical protein
MLPEVKFIFYYVTCIFEFLFQVVFDKEFKYDVNEFHSLLLNMKLIVTTSVNE